MKRSGDYGPLDGDEKSEFTLRDRSQVEVSPNPLRPSKTHDFAADDRGFSAQFAVMENIEEDLSEFEIHQETIFPEIPTGHSGA